jgi:hypothetical protein
MADIEVMWCYGIGRDATRLITNPSRIPAENANGRDVVLQRLHIRPSRIPAAGGVTFAASASGRYPGWRPHALCLPVWIDRTVASKKRMRGAAEMNLASQVAYRCGDSTG